MEPVLIFLRDPAIGIALSARIQAQTASGSKLKSPAEVQQRCWQPMKTPNSNQWARL